MRHKTAIRICQEWHSGQWSAFYQFASSGTYIVENHLRYLQEVETDLHQHEYALHPYEIRKKDERELTGLKAFFEKMGEKNGIKTEWIKHKVYGYSIPVARSEHETASKIIDLKYPI